MSESRAYVAGSRQPPSNCRPPANGSLLPPGERRQDGRTRGSVAGAHAHIAAMRCSGVEISHGAGAAQPHALHPHCKRRQRHRLALLRRRRRHRSDIATTSGAGIAPASGAGFAPALRKPCRRVAGAGSPLCWLQVRLAAAMRAVFSAPALYRPSSPPGLLPLPMPAVSCLSRSPGTGRGRPLRVVHSAPQPRHGVLAPWCALRATRREGGGSWLFGR